MGVGAGPGRADGPRGGKTGGKCGRGGVLALGQSRLLHGEMPAPDSLPGLPTRFLKPRDSLSTVWPKGALPLAPAASSHPESACLPPPGGPPAVHPLYPSS